MNKSKGMKKRRFPNVIIIIAFALVAAALLLMVPSLQKQQFNDWVIEGSSGKGKSLADGLAYAHAKVQNEVGQGMSWGWVEEQARQAAPVVEQAVSQAASSTQQAAQQATQSQAATQVQQTTTQAGGSQGFSQTQQASTSTFTQIQQAAGVVSQIATQATTPSAQSGKFRILVLGNNINQKKLNTYCDAFRSQLQSLDPFSQFYDRLQIDCSRISPTIPRVGTDAAAKAWILTLANAQKTEKQYDYAVVLHSGLGRSFAIVGVGSIVYTGYSRTQSPPQVAKTFVHEFGHLFAGLADEYVDEGALAQNNNVLEKLGLPRVNSQIDDINRFLIPAPNCIYKEGNSCPAGWFEGCALVATGTCRPSENSLMRGTAHMYFNEPSKQRILDVSNGLKLVK